MNTQAFLERALSARQHPTLYWLGKGGWQVKERLATAPTQPGRDFNVERELEVMRTARPSVHAEYMAALNGSGMHLDRLPKVACDCSGFVTWALGIARDGAPWTGGWIDTNNMYADALGAKKLFRQVDRAVPGTIIVYPKPEGRGAEGPPGHVGIVTEANAEGQATRVLHCSPTNYLLPPPPGLPSNAIAETDTKLFDSDPRTKYVVWRAFSE